MKLGQVKRRKGAEKQKEEKDSIKALKLEVRKFPKPHYEKNFESHGRRN